MEQLKYEIEDSTIAELLGVQNFTTDEAAILELVKNSYDAKALKMVIKFSENQLEIIDDGEGMSSEDIKTHWMHIGKSKKDYEIIDENNKIRIQAGSKGVGRFALSRLGSKVIMFSKKKQCSGVKWETDWNTSLLYKDEKNIDKGTKIIIYDLREKWNKNRIANLCKYLERTYNDSAMKIEIISEEYNAVVPLHFPEAKPGINCRSNIILRYDKGILKVSIISDEFLNEAKKYCQDVNLSKYISEIDIFNELKGKEIANITEKELKENLYELGEFSANFFFNLIVTNVDKEKFLYKYLGTEENVEEGITLYRNAFSISSYEGKKDWLGLGKRSRKSPAAASHPTGAWRVRENQMAGYVTIDKKKNTFLQDLSNRQGLDENIYYQLFVEIILIGITEFERYRQNIIRKINVKNKEEELQNTPISDKILKKEVTVSELTKNEVKQLISELKSYKKERTESKKEKEVVEARYKYDIRILNVLATIGLKASSIAHELKNDKNILDTNNKYIIEALKEYGMWDKLESPENTKKAYKNVPDLLRNTNKAEKKIIKFIETMLSEIEKRRFEAKEQNIVEILENIKNVWERDYAWIKIILDIRKEIIYNISEDIIQVIIDNLILNSVEQNDNKQHLNITIKVDLYNDLLKFIYSDDGKGLDKKYEKNPRKILEVHETTRSNGHGLGMWIVNNTSILSGGEVLNIMSNKGFSIEFTVGNKEIKR